MMAAQYLGRRLYPRPTQDSRDPLGAVFTLMQAMVTACHDPSCEHISLNLLEEPKLPALDHGLGGAHLSHALKLLKRHHG